MDAWCFYLQNNEERSFFLIYPGDGEIFYCLVFSRILFDKKWKFSNKNRKFFHSGIIPFLFFSFFSLIRIFAPFPIEWHNRKCNFVFLGAAQSPVSTWWRRFGEVLLIRCAQFWDKGAKRQYSLVTSLIRCWDDAQDYKGFWFTRHSWT